MRFDKSGFVLAMIASAIVAAPGVAAAQAHSVAVRATDYKFDAPASVAAGTVTFNFQNAGKEVHHLWLVQLRNGKTFNEFLKAMESAGSPKMPDWAVDVGGPNSVAGGASSAATVTLEPGTYAMVCYVPSPDGRPHVMKGMTKALTVTSTGATAASEPQSDVTIKMTDYAFDLSKAITAGTHVVRIENAATQSHEIVVGKLLAGKTMRQALEWLNNGQKGPAPVTLLGGASGLGTGRHQFISLNFEPGRYVFMCFIPDVTDGKPHSDHGMAKEITVAAPKASK